MAGSQLKALKASLKAHGLTGQTNVKKKGKKSKAPSDTRKDDKKKIIEQIREEFNPFELKTNRVKRDINEARKNKQVVGKPGISKQIGEEQRKRAYDETKRMKNRVGGIVDRRFGENNPHLNPEERMLERFTRERQITSKKQKSSLFNLEDDEEEGSDDDEYGGMQLTHYGQSLSLNDDDEAPVPENYSEGEEEAEEPARKKTKAEVMKEVIAKSKYYKHQRQLQQQQNENEIAELDDEFQDIVQELQNIKQPKKAVIEPKSQLDLQYDAKIKELAFDRRSVPADRTKTAEEQENERAERMKKLEADRLRRMQGLDDQENKKPTTADDLDDDFWAAPESGDEAEGFTIKNSDEEAQISGSESEEESLSDEEDKQTHTPRVSSGQNSIKIGNNRIMSSSSSNAIHVPCPSTHEEFITLLSKHKFTETCEVTRNVLNTYQPRLAAGNKEKMAQFSSVLLTHILYLSDNQSAYPKDEFVTVIEESIGQLRKMAEKYNDTLFETFKQKIITIQDEINASYATYSPKLSDLVFYSLVGNFYSTSDLYHLIVTPTLILITETLEIMKVQDSFTNLIKGVFLTDLLLQYQRLSKRFVPETVSFLEKALLCLIPDIKALEVTKLSTLTSTNFKSTYSMGSKDKLMIKDNDEIYISLSVLSSDNIKATPQLKSQVMMKIVAVLERFMTYYKSEPAFIEAIAPFVYLLKHLCKYHASVPQITDLLAKAVKLTSNTVHLPLKSQDHKPLAIATHAPKFEENFNPMKKSYDFDPQRQEVNKLKAQLKKERKMTLKEIRKDSKFEAREQIKEKKEMYQEYHSKMARIMNSISTEEGAEKNQYEREKKARKNKH